MSALLRQFLVWGRGRALSDRILLAERVPAGAWPKRARASERAVWCAAVLAESYADIDAITCGDPAVLGWSRHVGSPQLDALTEARERAMLAWCETTQVLRRALNVIDAAESGEDLERVHHAIESAGRLLSALGSNA